MRQARRIELRTRGMVESLFSGEYHSVFKGRGLEFSDVRWLGVGDRRMETAGVEAASVDSPESCWLEALDELDLVLELGLHTQGWGAAGFGLWAFANSR
ncbi:MAG: hypothetical protein IH968_17900 [Gemmatimonadetes bacterium]|nr:hypothetical protein [Gemmatimonadota bacterium]